MQLRKFALAAPLVLALAGCAVGVNFTKPADSQLVLGVSKQADVLAALGKPNVTSTVIINGKTLPTDTYAYAVGGSSDGALPGVTPARSLALTFSDGILVSKMYISSFKEDATMFDVDKAKAVKPGETEDEVVAALGKPGGKAVYPATPDANTHSLIYTFVQTKGFKTQRDQLIVEVDANGRVTKSGFSHFGSP